MSCIFGRPNLVVIDAIDFLAKPEPFRGFVMEPILKERSVMQIAAKRGFGKSWISLGISLAVASGASFAGFRVPERKRVLFIDPELDGRELQDQIKDIQLGMGVEAERDYLRLVPYSKNPDGLFNLATLHGQARLDEVVGDSEVIVIDSKTFVVQVEDSHRAEGFALFHDWLRNHRREGRTIVLTAHMGKSGSGARGSSAQEDLLDVCIELERPIDYQPTDGLRVVWNFTKARGLSPESQEGFELSMNRDDNGAFFRKAKVTSLAIPTNERNQRVRDMSRNGASQLEIMKELKISQPTVSRILRT